MHCLATRLRYNLEVHHVVRIAHVAYLRMFVTLPFNEQEMYGDFINEMKNSNLLKPFDEMFEFQLPLRNAKLKFHSKVFGFTCGQKKIHINSTTYKSSYYTGRSIKKWPLTFEICISVAIAFGMIQLPDFKL